MDEQDMSPEEVIARYKEQQRLQGKKHTKIFVGVVAVLAILSLLGSLTNSSDSTTSSTEVVSSSVDTSWITGDFIPWDNGSNLAYSIESVPSSSCGYGACLGIIVASKNGCPNSLYAEIELLDKNDVKIGYSNDSIGSLSSASKAQLIFNIQDSELSQAKMWNVTKISCY
jgi:hypothetical protein